MERNAKSIRTQEARRHDLIQGALRSIALHGFQNSTVQTISEEAGVSRGLMAHYFDSKEDLLLATFQYLARNLDTEVRRRVRCVGRDPLLRLMAVAAATFSEANSDRGHAKVWLAFWGIATWKPEALALHRRLWGDYRRSIERLMERAANERGLVFDTKAAALVFTQLVDGLYLGWVLEEAYTLDDAQKLLLDWLCERFSEPHGTCDRMLELIRVESAGQSANAPGE